MSGGRRLAAANAGAEDIGEVVVEGAPGPIAVDAVSAPGGCRGGCGEAGAIVVTPAASLRAAGASAKAAASSGRALEPCRRRGGRCRASPAVLSSAMAPNRARSSPAPRARPRSRRHPFTARTATARW
jgi:hypothetical protein